MSSDDNDDVDNDHVFVCSLIQMPLQLFLLFDLSCYLNSTYTLTRIFIESLATLIVPNIFLLEFSRHWETENYTTSNLIKTRLTSIDQLIQSRTPMTKYERLSFKILSPQNKRTFRNIVLTVITDFK